MTPLLDGKNIILYGAGGGIGRGVASTFAREGANLYLTGRRIEPLEAVAAMGGTGAADAATESFLRALAAEAGPSGVRVVGLWTAGVPQTFGLEDDANSTRKRAGLTPEQIEGMIAPLTVLGRAPQLDQVADTAAFLASDRAAGITGTIVNVTCGMVVG